MKVRNGFFYSENGDKIVYQIEQKLIDHQISLSYLALGKVYYYSRRKEGTNLEVKFRSIKITPPVQRTVEQFEHYISDIFKEINMGEGLYSLFTGHLKKIDDKYYFECDSYYKVNYKQYLIDSKSDEKEVLDYIVRNKVSAYSK